MLARGMAATQVGLEGESSADIECNEGEAKSTNRTKRDPNRNDHIFNKAII